MNTVFLRFKRLLGALAWATVAWGACVGPAQAGRVLDGVRQRAVLHCGVHAGRAGFAWPGESGQWSGLEVDYCRALAAAVLGSADKVKFVPVTSQNRVALLQGGEVDVLAASTPWTMNRDAALGLTWVGVYFHDGLALMVPRSANVKNIRQLNGATICTSAAAERQIIEHFRARKLAHKVLAFNRDEELAQSFLAGRCKALSLDVGTLAALKARGLSQPDQQVILSERLSKELLGPAVRRGDEEWLAIARWTLFAMLEAEELGISQGNVDALRASSEDEAVRRFTGAAPDLGRDLGLDKEWSYRIVRQVGNYGEVYDRHLGTRSPVQLPRGLNDLWTRGGLMIAPPMR